MKIAFVILNYNTYAETIECINSIENKIDSTDYGIVIVDNASVFKDYNYLNSKYINNKKVILIRLEKNLGFAKGNNVGIKYVNRKWNPDFVAVINSDTELLQCNLVDKISKEYDRSSFALLGPLVINADGRCDNSPHFAPSIEKINAELKAFKKERIYIHLGLYRVFCLAKKLKNLFRNKIVHKNYAIHRNKEFHIYQKQVVLQGCFLVFSKDAFNFIDGFNSETFLYYEEPILYLQLLKYNQIIVYNPDICIYHKDGRATNSISSKSRDKLLFINKCYIESGNILLQILKENKKNEDYIQS
jgi:GT2 family glycosyltransferase